MRRRILAAVIAGVSLASCASTSVQHVGSASYAPIPANADVVVFTADNQIKEPFEVIGVISYDDPGKYQILSLGDAIEPLKRKAREIGANGIIIDRSQPVKSGIISTGIYVEARAIRLTSEPTRFGEQHQAARSAASAAKQEPPPGELGTGFFIAEDGLVLTNAHVVKGCSEARIGPPGRKAAARVIARDGVNDLALLRSAAYPSAVAALRLSVRQGEAVVAFGYPLPGLLASGGNLTTGNITALSGIGDDSRLLQISTPVQPGNSGGPVLDSSGNVVGIVEGKLDAMQIVKVLGDIPQNVNFAIKASVMATFLESNSVHYATGKPGTTRSPADIAEEAKRFTVLVECSGSA